MRLLALFACLCLSLTGQAAAKKEGKKDVKKAEPVIKVVTPPAAPVAPLGERAAIWHEWTDKEGQKLDARFCGLAGDYITLQARDGRTFHFKLEMLAAEDVAFARSCVDRNRTNSFSPAVIASAAADIDRLVGAVLVANKQSLNAPATDEQFLRRIYLDAAGRVPTAKEAAAFLSSNAPDKRAKLIDELVFSPGYTMQMFNWMADLLRVKDTFAKGVPAFTFEDWLKARLAADTPWDKLVSEMITADGRLCDNGATGFMLFDAEMPLDGVSNLMTTFLGTNMACAQCHDHPLAEWKQRDFYQMAAFFGATDGKDEAILGAINRASKDAGLPKAAVKKIADINSFRMEDTDKQKLTFPKDYKYKDAKAGDPVSPSLIAWSKGDKSLPIYNVNTKTPSQLRDEFARWLTSPQNPRFATNIANRIWKKAFGLGVIEPVNDIDDLAQASSPELMAHLTFVMKAAKFDLREVQRVIYNSKTYQASASATPDLGKAKYLFNGPLVRRLSAEQVWDSLIVTAVGTYADNVLLRRGDDLKAMALPAGKVTLAEVKNAVDRAKAAFGGGGKAAGGKKAAGGSALGLANGYEGDKPVSRFSLMLARASELPQPSPETHFLRLWGQGERLLAASSTNDCSVPQVLQLMNGNVGRLVSDLKSHAVVTAYAEKSREAQITSLYLSYLSRRPTTKELAAAGRAPTAGLALADPAWALPNTPEFLLFH